MTTTNPVVPSKPYSKIFSDLNQTTKILLLNDLKLVNEDLKKIGNDFKSHATNIAFFSSLLILSAIPLLSFLILYLGEIWSGRYWLSSLVVGVSLFVIGLLGFMFFIQRLKKINFRLEKTSEALKREGEIIYRQFNKLQENLHAVQ